MWAAGSGGGGSIQDGDTEGQITTWDGDEWTPEGAVVVNGGNVGVGTDVAEAKLHVDINGGSNVVTKIENSGENFGSLIQFSQLTDGAVASPVAYIGQGGDNTGDLIINNASATNTKFYTDSQERMRIDADGNVNITGKLFINGEEVTAGGGGDSLWTDNGDGTISSAKTAKAPDFIAT
jgi:hypothetical protein